MYSVKPALEKGKRDLGDYWNEKKNEIAQLTSWTIKIESKNEGETRVNEHLWKFLKRAMRWW